MKQFDKAKEYCQETIRIRAKANDPELKFAFECMNDIKSAMRAAQNQNSAHTRNESQRSKQKGHVIFGNTGIDLESGDMVIGLGQWGTPAHIINALENNM